MNVNEHQQLDQRVRESPDLSASIIGSAMDAIIAIDDAQRIVLFNAAAEKIFGCPANEAVGSSVERFIPQRFRAKHTAHVRRFGEGGVTKRSMGGLGTLWGLRATGEEFPIEASISEVESGGKNFFTVVIRDITERHRAEEAVRESEQRFRLVADTAPVLMWMSGTDKLCTYFNKPWLDFTGRSIKEELGNGWAEGVHPEDLQRCMDTYTQAFDRREEFRMEYRLRRHDGEYRWVMDIGVPRFNQDCSFVGYIGIGVDVTERKLVENALQKSDERFRLAAQAGKMFAYEWDVVTDIVVRSAGFAKILGIDEEAHTTGEQILTRVHPDDREGLKAAVAELNLEKPYLQISFRMIRPDGIVIWVERNSRAYFDEKGKLLRIVGMVADITERKRIEEALQTSEERFRLAAQAGKMYAYEWDVATDKVMRSEEHVNVLGFSDHAKHLTRQQLLSSVHPDDRALFIGSVDQLTSQNPTTQISYRVLRPDGSVVWLEKNARAFFGGQGRMLRVIGMVADITERKRVERALEKSEEKFSKAFRQSPMALALTNAKDHHYIDVNETFERITGWRRDEVIGRTPFDIGLWVDPAERVEITKRLLAEGSLRNLELRFRMRDGSVRVGFASAELIELDGQPCVLGVTADVTEHKRAVEALRESEDKLRLLLDSTAEAIYGIDLEHRCTFCNPACVRALGYKQVDEVLGKKMHDLIHHSRADGTLFPVEECRIHSVIRTGEGVHAEDEVLWRANGTSFPAEYWSYPQRRGHDVVGAVVAFIDITERKLAEVALANVSRRLIEAQEQERTRIGRELHDDIVQRLALLAVELQQLHDNSLILPDVRNRMGTLQKQTSEIATDIQSLSHELHSAKLQYLGIAGAMRGFCREFGEQQKVEIDFHAHDLLSPLSPDTSLCFFRVLQEALHNAVTHSGVRHFEVRLWGTSDEIHLTVQDSGAGFDRKAAKASRGLGLISMEERLKLVNGTLSIDSQPKRGTTLHARVPLNSGSDSMSAAG